MINDDNIELTGIKDNAIHVIVPVDKPEINLGPIQTDIAVIEEHLKNQDKMLDDQNERFDQFIKGFQEFKESILKEAPAVATKKDIEEYKNSFIKQMIVMYGVLFTVAMSLAGWLYYWIESAVKIMPPVHH